VVSAPGGYAARVNGGSTLETDVARAPPAQYGAAVADYERSLTVGVGADAAFAFLADPGNLAAYAPPIAHVESIAVSGDPAEAAEEGEAEDARTAVRFLPDAGARRVEWGRDAYAGSATVEASTPSISTITFRLRVRDDADPDAIRGALDQAARNVMRLLLVRR